MLRLFPLIPLLQWHPLLPSLQPFPLNLWHLWYLLHPLSLSPLWDPWLRLFPQSLWLRLLRLGLVCFQN